jgi:hypothetical protein
MTPAMNQTMTNEQYRQDVRSYMERSEHPDVRTLRLQKERIIHEQEKTRWETAAKMQAEHLRREIIELGHEPEA